jgi:Ca2+-binding EF-hand superfamily protein
MRSASRIFTLATALALVVLAGQAAAQAPAQSDWRENFTASDRNADGRIDRAEFQDWMVEVFFRRDAARKGYLVLEDVKGIMTPETFAAANRKVDGKLWLGEFLNTLFQDFDAIDVHKNGWITIEEIEAYIRPSRK